MTNQPKDTMRELELLRKIEERTLDWQAADAQVTRLQAEVKGLREALLDVLDTVSGCHDCWELSSSDEQKKAVEQALSQKGSDDGE